MKPFNVPKMGVSNVIRLAVLIVQSLLLSQSFSPELNRPRFQQTSTSSHIREPLTWFQDNVDKLINLDQPFEAYQPIVESSSQPQSKRTNIFSKIFSVFRKNIAILSVVFLLPTASFARSSSAKKLSNESPKPTSELVKVLKKKGSKTSVVVIEKSQKAKQSLQQLVGSDEAANDEEIFQQRLKYIGIGLTAASILATLLSGDDKPSSSKSGKKSSGPTSSRDNTISNNNSRSIPNSTTPYKPSATSSTSAPSPPLSSIKKTVVPKRPIASSTPTTTAKTSITPQSTINNPPPSTRKAAAAVVANNNDEEDDDDLFGDADVDSIKPLPPITTTKSATTSTTTPSTRIRTPLTRTPLSTNAKAIVTPPPQPTPISPPAADITPSPPSPPVTITTPPVTPAPPAKKQGGGGILSRIFQKPGGNRDPSLAQVLKTQDSATEFRIVTANLLAQLLPTASSSASVLAKDELFQDLSADGGRMYDPRVEAVAAARETALAQAASKPSATATTSITTTDAEGNVTSETPTSAVEEDHSNDAAAKLLEYIATESDLSPSQAAEAFAEVTSAMLVTLIDEAVVLYEQKEREKDKTKSESYDENILLALDSVTDFVAQAGSLYAKNYVSIAIDPVQYNGKSKRNSVESLYLLYFKSSAQWQMKQVFESMNQSQKLQQQQEEESAAAALSSVTGGSTETKSSTDSEQESEEEKVPTAEEIRESQRVDKAGLLQRALGIKEGKRNSLEQKAQKDIMMNMSGGMGLPSGSGGGGGLGDMFQSIKGAAGGGGMPDMSAINNMMGGGGGGFPGGMPGADSADNPFKDMSQEEMMEMTKQSIAELKNMLAEGNVTKDMVIEMEKGMGIDFNAFVKMMDLPGAKENLKKVGPEMVEMLGMFKQLVQIKKAA